eukprot:2339149-Prymnesium_polylepis.1
MPSMPTMSVSRVGVVSKLSMKILNVKNGFLRSSANARAMDTRRSSSDCAPRVPRVPFPRRTCS